MISFLAIVGVGVFFMGGDMAQHESCLATAINGFSCPTESVVGETVFHLNAAHALTAFLLIAPFLFFVIAIRGLTSMGGRTSAFLRCSTPPGRGRTLRTFPQTLHLARWRALHELSPTEE